MAARRKRATTTRARPRSRSNTALKNAAAAVVGGATGAMVGGLLVRSGIKPATAAVGVTVAGGVAAATMKGMSRLAAGGAAAAGAGQLALGWLANQSQSKAPIVATSPAVPPPRRRNLDGADVQAAFERAREEIAMLDQASAFASEESDDGDYE